MASPAALFNSLVVAASSIQAVANEAGLGITVEEADPLSLFDRVITEPEILRVSRSLFRDGYYARSVEQCFKVLVSEVRRLATATEDGTALMQSTFSSSKPRLRINPGADQSDRDERHGYMELFTGAVRGIRNPRSHDAEREDDATVALELITFGNHLLRKAKLATLDPGPATKPPGQT